MIKKFKIHILLMILVTMSIFFVGCTPIDNLQKKFGLKNNYFEYLNTNNVDKISIQSTRDPGFKFIVTEDNAIKDMYTLLSKAEVSETKSDLEADYIFEFNLGDEIKSFYYVVGINEGNFYNDEIVFSVSKRLDEGIIKNLSVIRKPREFDYIYYESILELLDILKGKVSLADYKVGINIQSDVECLKYVFSIDLQKFIESAKKIVPNIELVKNNEEEFDIVLTLNNRGYDSTNYKSKITVNNKKDKIVDEYFVTGINEYKEWDITISEPNDPPKGW